VRIWLGSTSTARTAVCSISSAQQRTNASSAAFVAA
jgi:hypothetical protein